MNSAYSEGTTFAFSITVPAYAATEASAFNVLNTKNSIEQMTLISTDNTSSYGSSRNKVSKTYTAENGHLVQASMSEDHEDMGTIKLSFQFEKVTIDNHVTNTTGIVKSSDGGY